MTGGLPFPEYEGDPMGMDGSMAALMPPGGGLPPPSSLSPQTRMILMEQIKRLSQPQERKPSLWTDPAFLAGLTLLGGGNMGQAGMAAARIAATAEQAREMGDARRASAISGLTGKLADADKASVEEAKARRDATAKALSLVPSTKRGLLGKLLRESQVDPTDIPAVYGLIEQNQLPLAGNFEFKDGILWDMSGDRPTIAGGKPQITTMREGGNDVTYRVHPDGRMERLAVGQAWAPEKPDQTLVEIADDSSPTGTRMVPRSQAAGQPGKPASGMIFESDGKGGMRLVQGRVGPGGNLDRQTVKEIEERQLNQVDALARLDEIEKQYDPSFLRLAPRTGQAITSMKDFMGVSISPEDQESLTRFAKFRQSTTRNLNQTIKEITGAAMGVQEAERIISTMPNAGTGVFDGDSPTAFKAKLDGAIQATRNALMRYAYAKKNGLPMGDPKGDRLYGIALDDMPRLVSERGAALFKEIGDANPGASPEAVRLAVRDALAAEFGTGNIR